MTSLSQEERWELDELSEDIRLIYEDDRRLAGPKHTVQVLIALARHGDAPSTRALAESAGLRTTEVTRVLDKASPTLIVREGRTLRLTPAGWEAVGTMTRRRRQRREEHRQAVISHRRASAGMGEVEQLRPGVELAFKLTASQFAEDAAAAGLV
jgi:DNA-binding MarR family transcriptional regulator